MNKELKARWVEALRSGKYIQSHHRLKSGNTYCCLGVLVDVYDPNKWKNDTWGLGAAANLPSRFLAEIELTNVEQGKLVSLNDVDGLNFEEIADHVERML